MMGQNQASNSDCKEIEAEENFSEKVEYIYVNSMSGLGVSSAGFGGANLLKQYAFGEIDTSNWLVKN